MQNEWQDEAHRRLGHCWDFGVDYQARAWQLKVVEFREEEVKDLDRFAFKDLVRRKLGEIGDDLMKAFEERQD